MCKLISTAPRRSPESPKRMRRLVAASVFVVVLTCFLAACAGNLFSPSKKILCPGALYCGSPSVPQVVDGGTCCVVVDISANSRALPNAQVGYLCAYGASRQPAGCVATLEQARFVCPTAPSIVRCTAE